MSVANNVKRTPLYESHKALGAKFTEFGGWDMPVRYRGQVEEHHSVRQAAGLFDVSHMGEVFVEGPKALSYLQRVTTNDVSELSAGEAQYSLLLNHEGGVVDDIIVYCLDRERYLLCVNAGNRKKDFDWLLAQNEEGALIEDRSDDYVQLALQGPRAAEVLAESCQCLLSEFSKESFPGFTQKVISISLPSGVVAEALVARTGYTGEDGFELFLAANYGVELWQHILACGESWACVPVGLGARDTLRLEVCYPLYGHELRADIPASCCRVGWVIKPNKGDFIGRHALLEIGKEPKTVQLVGLEVQGKGIVRAETQLFDGDANIGHISSGTMTPSVGKAVALAFVKTAYAKRGATFEAEVRGKRLDVVVVKTPFYKRP